MSVSPVLAPEVPALPDDTQLSQQLEHRPNWQELSRHIEGITGKMLFESGEFGEMTLEQITEMDTQIKKYEPLFLKWYWDSPFGAVEKAAEQFRDGIRFAEMRRCKAFRNRCSTINGEFSLARRQEGERRRAAQELEQAKQAPNLPASVSLQQASVDLPKAPPTITATPVYEYTVDDWPKLLRWLADNPIQVEQLSVSIKFTSLKYKQVQIPGVKVAPLPDKVANRAR